MSAAHTLSKQTDAELVRACLEGNEVAWSVLIDRYSRLIYSVAAGYRLAPEDAADVFQGVCMELYCGLSRLREAASLRRWLVTVTSHECHRTKNKRLQTGDVDDADQVPADELADSELLELERSQILRQAIDELPPRCAEMVRLLFFEDPPIPYADLARRQGLAAGSIGFIRGRCLKKLRENLERLGF